jgi:hypothetical protein
MSSQPAKHLLQRRAFLRGGAALTALALAPKAWSDSASWRADIDAIANVIRTRHIAPFDLLQPAAFEQLRLDCLNIAAQNVDERTALAVQQWIGAVGDFHTTVDLPELLIDPQPFRLKAFRGGWFVTEATPAQAHLLGARVHEIAGLSPDDWRVAYRSLARYPLEAEFRALFNRTLQLSLAHLRAQGLTRKSSLDIRYSAGFSKSLLTQEIVFLPQAAMQDEVAAGQRPPLAVEAQAERYYFTFLVPQTQCVVLVYRRCVVDPSYSLSALSRDAIALARSINARRAVIDLRGNGGGNSALLDGILPALARDSGVSSVRALTDAGTQSSALLNAYTLRSTYGAQIVGETAGTALNHLGEVQSTGLPSGRRMTYSVRRFTLAPNDPRGRAAGLDPDIAVLPDRLDMLLGRDTALEAAMSL